MTANERRFFRHFYSNNNNGNATFAQEKKALKSNIQEKTICPARNFNEVHNTFKVLFTKQHDLLGSLSAIFLDDDLGWDTLSPWTISLYH